MHNQREQQHLGIVRGLLLRMFGQPKGILGQLGGLIMVSMNRNFAQWIIHLPLTARRLTLYLYPGQC